MPITRKHVAGGTAAGVIACCIAFTPGWEGMDLTAKPDVIGTGHPITYCFGQTDEFGKVRAGDHFTPAQCDALLAASLPKYLNAIKPCVKVAIPDESMAALLDAAYNAGSAAVCRSPMVAKINAGDLKAGCEAFDGWYVRSDGKVRKGLIARRSGDKRKGEKQLCLEGLNKPEPPVAFKPYWYQRLIKQFFPSA
jgi:lysozyme